MQQRHVCQQFNQNFLKSPPSPVKGAPGPFAAFLRLFPLLVGLHSRLHLFRAKDPLDPPIAGGAEKNRKPQSKGFAVLLVHSHHGYNSTTGHRPKSKEAGKHLWGLPALITVEQDRAGRSMAAHLCAVHLDH